MNRVVLLHMMQLFLLASCADKSMSLDDWRDFLNDDDNGLQAKAQWNDVDLSLAFKPADALVWQELGYTQKPIRKSTWDSLSQKYEAYAYFDFTLSRNDMPLEATIGTDDSRYFELIQHLSFRMRQHARVITDLQDTISLFHAQYFRNYGQSSASNVMLVFENKKILNSQKFEVRIDDIGLNMPTKKFQFETVAIKNIPHLSLETYQ